MRFKSRMVVHLNYLEENIKSLREISKTPEVIFMVKANAYGHGIVPIVSFCYEETGIKEFGLATLGEALFLRENLPKAKFEAYVFSDTLIELATSSEHYLNRRIIPVISNFEDLSYFLSNKDFSHFPLCLKFNTGMNRLGIDVGQVEAVVNQIRLSGRKSIDHLMTHFACASLSVEKNSHNLRQMENFTKLKSDIRATGISIEKTSLSNSGLIEQRAGLDESHIRPGLMLYGPSSLRSGVEKSPAWNGKIISSLQTYVIKCFEVTKGTPVGYGSNPCPENGMVAIVALGYGDGVGSCYLGLKFKLNNDEEARVVGRVNMDMVCLLLPENSKVQTGDLVSLWDEDPSKISKISAHTKLLPYEVFCSISSRVPRLHQYK